jgi:OmpA-OmpF porin, OOP family
VSRSAATDQITQTFKTENALENSMQNVKTAVTLALMALGLAASPPSMADGSPWYVGANLGQARAKIDDPSISNGQLGNDFVITSINDDDHHSGYKLFGGYQVNSNLVLEAGYFDLGSFGFNATTQPSGTLQGTTRLKGLNFDLVGILPITGKFSAFGRLGADYVDAKDSFNGSGFVDVRDSRPSKRNMSYKFGLGLQYDFTEHFAGRAEAERYRVDPADGNKGDVDLFSLGVVYRFGE